MKLLCNMSRVSWGVYVEHQAGVVMVTDVEVSRGLSCDSWVLVSVLQVLIKTRKVNFKWSWTHLSKLGSRYLDVKLNVRSENKKSR